MKYGLLHFCGIDSHFCNHFAAVANTIEFVSIPAFASGHIELEAVKQYWPQCTIFDIASWNSFDSANRSFASGGLLNSTERLHVLAQSERLSFIADLSIHERLLLIEQQS